MARVLVTFATRKRLTSFVGRPDRLRRQAHPAQPSTPCIRLSRPWRSFTTSRMERVGKCAERGEQRPLPPQRRQGRLRGIRVVEAAPLQGHVGRLEVRPHLPAFRLERVARALRGPAGRNIPRGRRPSWLAERSEPAGSQSPSGHHRLLVPGRRFAQAEHRHGHPDRLQHGRTHEHETRTYRCFPRFSNSLCTTLNTSSK